jgi:predicted RND superfamily exporter protein
MNCAAVAQQAVERFARWLDRYRNAVLVLSLLFAVVGAYLAGHMKVEASLTNLLPPQQTSVLDLHAITERARPFGTINVLLESDNVELRTRAGEALAKRLATVRPDLVAQLVIDDAATQRYAWEHRFLWAKLDDLVAARDALKARIEHGKLAANPLYISLDDDEAAGTDRFDELEKQLDELEQKAKNPAPRVSKDGRFQLIVIQTTFAGSDAHKANELIGEVKRSIEATDREVGRGVLYQLTGNITVSMYEHDSVLEGMSAAALLTVGLCAIALWIYYRRGRIVLAILWALAVGVASTFAVAWLTIGHLNVMTAFLFAIVIGNGINSGMILAARFLEELRAGHEPGDAMPVAMSSTLRGTGAAMATAAAAYTSLLVTDFRGFQQFGAIAGIGMLLTWLTAYTVLPALLFAMARFGLVKAGSPPTLGVYLEKLVPAPRGYPTVLAIGAVVTAIATVIAIHYIAADPFTKDWRDLQSTTSDILGARKIDAKIRGAFDSSSMLSGQAYQVVIAVERRDQVAPLVAKLRAADELRPPEKRWMRDARSLDDAIPPDQDKKRVVLHEIDDLIGDSALQATLSDEDKVRIEKLRPPRELAAVTDADVPMALAWPFVEKDGSRGKLIVIRGAPRFNSFDVSDRLAFAREVQTLELPPGALVAGEPLVVADIIKTMESDAPKIIGFALAGSVLTVLLVLGFRRHGAVTLASGTAGVVLMIAVCSLLGLKVHFLDLIALPITIGIGIDYAVNLAARDRQDGERGPRHLVATTGSTVLLCSYTTAVGYGTLMLSANGGIRAFGLAALVGELACITMALIVAPVLLARLRGRDPRPNQ